MKIISKQLMCHVPLSIFLNIIYWIFNFPQMNMFSLHNNVYADILPVSFQPEGRLPCAILISAKYFISKDINDPWLPFEAYNQPRQAESQGEFL